jgi:uncharacterized protein (TIGR02722 family)
MKKRWGWAVVVLLAAGLAGCAGSVQRISSDEVVDLSGRWNDTDSQLVSEKMVKDALAGTWLTQFLKAKGKNPTVIVGLIKNKTDEHIALDTFEKDIERNLTNSGAVEFVAGQGERDEVRAEREDQQSNASEATRKQMSKEAGADYMLQGTVSKIIDASGRTATFFYEISLEMVDMQRNVKVWYGDEKIKKVVKGARARY